MDTNDSPTDSMLLKLYLPSISFTLDNSRETATKHTLNNYYYSNQSIYSSRGSSITGKSKRKSKHGSQKGQRKSQHGLSPIAQSIHSLGNSTQNNLYNNRNNMFQSPFSNRNIPSHVSNTSTYMSWNRQLYQMSQQTVRYFILTTHYYNIHTTYIFYLYL